MLNENKEQQLRNVVNFNSVTVELCINTPEVLSSDSNLFADQQYILEEET